MKLTETKEPAPLKSYELVTEELVIAALKKDKGSEVELLSWELIPFTNKGDNYSSVVISIEVLALPICWTCRELRLGCVAIKSWKCCCCSLRSPSQTFWKEPSFGGCLLKLHGVKFRKDGVVHEDSFVAKVNPLRPITFFTDAMEKAYTRETDLLFGIIGGMNKQLQNLGLDPIRTPRLYAKTLEKGREAFVTENLRKQGFKMYDRMKGMDLNHALFVVKEIGRFHASSLLFEDILPTKSITDTFPGVKGSWLQVDEEGMEIFTKRYTSLGETTSKVLRKSDPKYEKCSNWLWKHSADLGSHYKNGFETNQSKFDVLLHGDCWTNNMLFRYNEDGIPIDFRFVDLQCSSKGSATSDINYFFYTSLNGHFRRENYNTLVTAYYESFSEVMKRSKNEPPFSYLELKQEVQDNNIFGMASGMLVLQFFLAQEDEIPDLDFTGDNLDEYTEARNKSLEKMSQRDGPFRDRYMAIFDDMVETTIFDED